MAPTTRRAFLSDIGHGMLAAGLGASLAADLGFSTAFAEEGPESLPLGADDALVDLMRGTPPQQLQPLLVEKLRKGEADLRGLIAAGALANALTFGGHDYVGFHTAMALLPALEMSRLMPADRRPLPVLKVLYRNSQQIQALGGASHAALAELHALEHGAGGDVGVEIRDACRRTDLKSAEDLLATSDSPEAAMNALQPAVQDDMNVHRFVFAHRTYGLVGLLGREHAHTLLRQCVRLCIDHEQDHVAKGRRPEIRTLLPRLLDQYKLAGRGLGQRDPGDAAVEDLARVIYTGPRDRAADAVAAALAEGIDPEIVGEAISLASNLYVLRQGADNWRSHGDAAGVHSSDATNAWRNMARVVEPRHAATGLIVAAYHAGVQSAPYQTPAYPTDDHRATIKAADARGLLAEAEDAVRHNDQGRAAAAIAVYGERGHDEAAAFDLLLKYAVSEDGRLHGEKYYQTVREEFRTTRPAFRWRQLVALARVTASARGYGRNDEHGVRAAGYDEACGLLGVDA